MIIRFEWIRCHAQVASITAVALSGVAAAPWPSPLARQPRILDRPQSGAAIDAEAPYRALVSTYCVSCHNSKVKAGSLELDTHQHRRTLRRITEAWEKVALKLRARQMPPLGLAAAR